MFAKVTSSRTIAAIAFGWPTQGVDDVGQRAFLAALGGSDLLIAAQTCPNEASPKLGGRGRDER